MSTRLGQATVGRGWKTHAPGKVVADGSEVELETVVLGETQKCHLSGGDGMWNMHAFEKKCLALLLNFSLRSPPPPGFPALGLTSSLSLLRVFLATASSSSSFFVATVAMVVRERRSTCGEFETPACAGRETEAWGRGRGGTSGGSAGEM